ncbi:hypothetical protein [Alicyclobacillus sp. SO9]|uniref:hypothetical protein n=1 Tax=Alicyclobacillus sp. SO9 TaxID=2665646 RepID=UPI0018E74C9E|nr:hypothetical protein [Alicyclobacillus sp. SO9]QQE76918.1 hypothetical protein GI364_12995 [Alicyclobacillus sp. SO9]
MSNDSSGQSIGTMFSAFLTFCIVAAAIFAGWHFILRYAPANPYKTPQKPYVSVSKAIGNQRVVSLEKKLENEIIDFWRFGAV